MKHEKQMLPDRQSQAYKILSLIAISGELPSNQIKRLSGGGRYKEEKIKELKSKKLIRTYYREKLRGYRLMTETKDILITDNNDRFAFFLSGNADTNILKSEITRRLRLKSIAETIITMQNAGVSVYRDEKPDVFKPNINVNTLPFIITSPAFYNSREIKALGSEFVKIQGARSVGVLLSEYDSFQNRYPLNQWQEILGNCDVQLFLGCTDELTAKFISDRTGEASINVSSKAKQLGTWRISDYTPEYRETSGVGKRKLLTMDEVLRFPIDKALVIIRGQKVLQVDKFDYSNHPESKKLISCKASEYTPNWKPSETVEEIEYSPFAKPPDKQRATKKDTPKKDVPAKSTTPGGESDNKAEPEYVSADKNSILS